MNRLMIAMASVFALSSSLAAEGLVFQTVVASTIEAKAELSTTLRATTPAGAFDFTPALEFSPVSIAGRAALTWSAPLPLVTATMGTTVGSGWKFLDISNGLGRQDPASTIQAY